MRNFLMVASVFLFPVPSLFWCVLPAVAQEATLADPASEVPEAGPQPVPRLTHLIQPWAFVRASEASTLFIDEAFKGRAPYGHLIVLDAGKYQWLEFDGKATTIWKVREIKEGEADLQFSLKPVTEGGEPGRLLVYSYRDIDDCLVMIRFAEGAKENPVRFTTPYSGLKNLPYGKPEE